MKPIDLNRKIPDHIISTMDQHYALAHAASPTIIAEAKRVVLARGEAAAAALLGIEHLERTNGNPYMLASAIGVLLVELVRQAP